MIFRFRDIHRLSPHSFTFENMIRFECGTPCYRDTASGWITIEKPWAIVGWSDQVDERLMHGREGQIAIMLFHPERGEFWQHYPLVDKDMRDAAVFDGLLMRKKMEPERKQKINGHTIEEFWWGWKLVVYVDGKVFRGSFEQAMEMYGVGDLAGRI